VRDRSWWWAKAAVVLVAVAWFGASRSAGQVTLDTGPGGPVPVPLLNSTYAISDTDGVTVGNINLFHSFSEFRLNSGETALFTGPATIQNVLARVTGVDGVITSSLIDGTIDSTAMPDANFFFINPAGVMFGPNAQLNVGGSFVVTTADYVKLDDGAGQVGRFDARNPANDVLISAPPRAFGFLGPSESICVGDCDVNLGSPPATLLVTQGRSLSLIGGDIQIVNGTLSAPAGRINLISVQSEGEVNLDLSELSSDVDTAQFAELGSVLLSDSSTLDVSGDPRSGKIVVHAEDFEMNSALLFADNYGTENGLGVSVNVRSRLLLNGSFISAIALGDGDGGDVSVATSIAVLENGSTITTDAIGNGKGGNIQFQADSLDVSSSFITASASSAAQGGNISISASVVHIDLLSLISTTTFEGTPGSITIQAENLEIHNAGITSESFGNAAGGDIQIVADFLNISGDGTVSTSTFGPANGGSIDVIASSITMNGADALGFTGVAARSLDVASGSAGSITIRTDTLRMENGSSIAVSADQSSGGDIDVDAGSEIRLIDSQITAQAMEAGGNVHLTTPLLVYLLNSSITAEAVNGDGGNVTIDPTFVILNHSLISANAVFGDGGDINIVTDFFLSSDSQVTASSEFGLQGSVTITAPDVDLSGNLAELESDLLAAESQLGPHCAVRLPGGVSSFVVTGRGGAPVAPDSLVPALPTLSGERGE